ncbi:hypothetical protein [Otariodibacter oris]|uniref:Uncharacterized protein n=1 Tax=Otariodibacter oris TaxID=1032623 RepID=A0A420XHV3_9PAST|nr:hypothetical protein [Otariodibacter oris]QGM80872.1 hypothetical protein A6A10_05385 [Otariodibacter oris]RKR76954.1 hypothetical protein DES31_0265 [Otariodibacter oris]
MTTPYSYTSKKQIAELYAKASLKPISLLNCENFSNTGKIGLLLTISFYITSSLLCIYWFTLDTSIKQYLLLSILLLAIVWLLRYMIDVLLKLYQKNLEYEFKNLPSPKKLLKVINGMLAFAEKEGFTRDSMSVFISENLRDEINIGKTTINKWFAMSNDAVKNKL